MSAPNRQLPATAEATSTIAGNPPPGVPVVPPARGRRRPEPPALAAQLRTLAAAEVWRRGWESTVDAEVGSARADLLCRSPKGTGRVALVLRLDAPSPNETAAMVAEFESDKVRSAWFCGRGFAAPAAAKPTPVFRLAASSTADAVAVLPDSGLALPFVDAVAALFDQRIQYREHRLLAGPWLVELAAVRVRCWRCGAPSAAVEWSAARSDNHGRVLRAEPELAGALAARALDVAVFCDPRGERVEQARLSATGSASAFANSCPACSAAFGPDLVAEVRRESPPLGTVVVALAAPRETIDSGHWCAAPGSSAATCCPEQRIEPDVSWLSACRIAPLVGRATLASALAGGGPQ